MFRYQWITGNMNFFLFLAVLAIVYIANGHLSDRTTRNISKTENELKELQYEYKTIKSEVMFSREEGEVLKSAAPMGLQISREIPQRLSLQKK